MDGRPAHSARPDLLVAPKDAFNTRDLPKAPVLAVEVLSPSTRRIDLPVKARPVPEREVRATRPAARVSVVPPTLGHAGAVTTPQSARAVTPPTPGDLDAAWSTVREHLAATPVDLGAATADDPVLKLESLQPTGSFKVRGALNALGTLDPGVPVVTASAGNHGLGVALAARRLSRRATVVVATTASRAKIDRLRRLGVDLVETGTSYDDAEAHALRLSTEGARFLSGYNETAVIAGQGTIGLELDDQVPGPLTVVCGVGGGGLASGLGLWASRRRDVRVVGVEAKVSTAVSAAIAAGHQVTVEVGETLADGMAGNLESGSVTVDLVARYVDELVTVSEAEICSAIRYLASERGYVAEGAGAAPVAALRAGKVAVHGRPVAVISGRNIALPTLATVLAGI